MNTYRSTHWGLSQYLCYHNYPILAVSSTPGAMFVQFEDKDGTIKDIADKFFSREGLPATNVRLLLDAGNKIRKAIDIEKSKGRKA